MAEKKWIQKAINPKHRGFCTPMTKKTCTPARKAFAKRAKAGKLQAGGADQSVIDPNYDPLNEMQQQVSKSSSNAPLSSSAQEQLNNPGSFANTKAGQKMMTRYQKNAAYLKDANVGITAITNVANAIQDQKQKREEYLQTVRSMTPKFMTNSNQGGLNNIPAYNMFGGDDRAYPSMQIGGEADYLGPDSSTVFNHDNQEAKDRQLQGIAHTAFYGSNSMIPEYKAGGEVSSGKAKEILRDGTIHGKPITDKQRRYFGWIAGGRKMLGGWGQGHTGGYQTGGVPSPAQNASNPEDYYKASATLLYYKDQLNNKLKSKNTQGFGDYFKGLQGARTAGGTKPQEYIQNSGYNDYLTPDEVKKTLGTDKDYQNYLNSLKAVNEYDVQQGKQPLYGNIEGESNDPSKLNYGRRFASLQLAPHYGKSDATTGKNYGRSYNYNPKTGQVDFTDEGTDMSLRPEGFAPLPSQNNQTPTTPAVTPRQYGGKKTYMVGGMRSIYKAGGQVDLHHMAEAYQTGGYNIGDEVDLTPAQITELKKQGYKIKVS